MFARLPHTLRGRFLLVAILTLLPLLGFFLHTRNELQRLGAEERERDLLTLADGAAEIGGCTCRGSRKAPYFGWGWGQPGDQLLQKPFTPHLLPRRVRKALEVSLEEPAWGEGRNVRSQRVELLGWHLDELVATSGRFTITRRRVSTMLWPPKVAGMETLTRRGGIGVGGFKVVTMGAAGLEPATSCL